jgi:hypothetical protein
MPYIKVLKEEFRLLTVMNECIGACHTLIYCGVDNMTYLNIPADQEEVHREDFIQWANKYICPNLRNNITQITGEELYSARCAVVRTYTVESRKTKTGSARMIGYFFGGEPPLAYDKEIAPNLILIRLETLRDAFYMAIDKFFMESYADKQKQKILEARLKKIA